MTKQIIYNEEDSIRLLKSGDQQLFGTLYDNYARALLGMIKRRIENDTIAEDLLQETFIKIWDNRSHYDHSKGRLFTWMVAIAQNLSIDYLRSKQNKFDEKINRTEDIISEIDKTTHTATQVDHIGLNRVVTNLKEEQRKLIDLVYFEGFTQEEISKKLNLPLGTIKTRVRSALITLRKEMI